MVQTLMLQPELFALVGIGIFLALSLLTYLLGGRFPKKLSYIYQIGAFLGFLCLVISRFIFFGSDESIRLWYCYSYLIAALANIIGANIWLVFPKHQFRISKIWSIVFTLPSVFVAVLFVTEYGFGQTVMWSIIEQISVFTATVGLGIGTGILLISQIKHRSLRSHTEEVTY
jgi:hypothetical protein